MQSVQNRPVPAARVIVVALAGLLLIAGIGFLYADGAIELPVVGRSVESGDGLQQATDRNRLHENSAAGYAPSNVPGFTDQAATKSGHRYQMYLSEGGEAIAVSASYSGFGADSRSYASHRFFTIEMARSKETVYPEHHRIGQLTD